VQKGELVRAIHPLWVRTQAPRNTELYPVGRQLGPAFQLDAEGAAPSAQDLAGIPPTSMNPRARLAFARLLPRGVGLTRVGSQVAKAAVRDHLIVVSVQDQVPDPSAQLRMFLRARVVVLTRTP
jgi:hypothetical protein